MPSREFLAEGRASVGLFVTASVCTRSSSTGVLWTSCRSWVWIRLKPLFATSSLCYSEAGKDQGPRVKLEFEKNLV